MSSSIPLPSTDRLRPKPYSESVLANREWVRLFAVLGAVAVDLTLLLVATVAAAYVRYGNVTGGDSGVLLLMMLPAYLFASLTYDAYSLDTLRRAPQSAGRANLALFTAAAFAFTAAYALHVSSRFSRLETGYLLAAGTVLISFGRFLGARLLENVRSAIEPSIFLLGDETAPKHGRFADRVINIRRLDWTPSAEDPDFLDMVCRTFRHADRVLLVFADPQERVAWPRSCG